MRAVPRAGRPRSALVALVCCLPGVAAVGALLPYVSGSGRTPSVPVWAAVPGPAAPAHDAPRSRIVPRSAWLDATPRASRLSEVSRLSWASSASGASRLSWASRTSGVSGHSWVCRGS
ncbi:hypothetical protein ACIQMV_03550, partial [Streptomyces sp. NPDC091412]